MTFSRSLSMKTGPGARGSSDRFVPSGRRLVGPAVDERVQVERPQPRSGEDERPGGARRRRQNGAACREEGDPGPRGGARGVGRGAALISLYEYGAGGKGFV